MHDLLIQSVINDTHMNMSELIRDAIRSFFESRGRELLQRSKTSKNWVFWTKSKRRRSDRMAHFAVNPNAGWLPHLVKSNGR